MSDRVGPWMARIPRKPVLLAAMAALVCLVGLVQSWSLALAILNLCLISAIMTLGVNIQWGYRGPVQLRRHGLPPPSADWRACWSRCRR